MREFLVGFIVGLISLFVQLQYGLSIETWLWFVGLIAIVYVGATAFIPALARYSLGLAGFLIGVMISLAIWTFLPEIQNFFSSIFG